MRLPEYCATHTFKEFLEMLGPDFYVDNTRGVQFVHDEFHVTCQATFKDHCQFPKCDCDRPKVTAEQINSTEFPRAKNNGWLEAADVLDGPEQECFPIDPLLDRGCSLFDGNCDCPRPALYTCKRYTDHMKG